MYCNRDTRAKSQTVKYFDNECVAPETRLPSVKKKAARLQAASVALWTLAGSLRAASPAEAAQSGQRDTQQQKTGWLRHHALSRSNAQGTAVIATDDITDAIRVRMHGTAERVNSAVPDRANTIAQEKGSRAIGQVASAPVGLREAAYPVGA
jgi:hypothetical protein